MCNSIKKWIRSGMVLTTMLAGAFMLTPTADAAWKPMRPVTIIVPAGEGGGADLPARTIAKAAESLTHIKFVVENIPGGAGQVGIAEWLNRSRDGHTIFLSTCEHTSFTAQGLVFKLDQVKPVIMLQKGPATLLAKADNGKFKNFDEMVAYAKKGNNLQVSVFRTPHSFDDFMLKAITKAYGIEFTQVPYAKATERYSSLLGNHVDLLSQRAGDVAALIKGKKMIPLLLNNKEVSKILDIEAPTFDDKNISFPLQYWRGIWMAEGSPAEAIAYFEDLFTRAMQTEEWKNFEMRTGYINGYMNSKDFGEYMKNEVDFIAKAVAEDKK